MRCSAALALLALLWVGSSGCRTSPPPASLQRFEFSNPHMGTLFSITLFATNQTAAQHAARQAFQRIAELDEIMSDYQADSELMKLCDQPAGTAVHISADLFAVLERAQAIAERSRGAFDVTVGPYVRLWRFARKRKVLPPPEELAAAAKVVGYKKLKLDRARRTAMLTVPGMRLDLGGIAKGYAADQALRLLASNGWSRALVAASGDIALGDPPPGQNGWKTGVTAIDEKSNRAERRVTLKNAGISTSGDTEQFVEIGGVRYSHIVNPHTGLGLTNRIQATVLARDAATTDALATTVCVLGPERGLALAESMPGVSALILTSGTNGAHSYVSRRFPKLLEDPIRQ